jgi:outer membrane biosynthesis protein TonB
MNAWDSASPHPTGLTRGQAWLVGAVCAAMAAAGIGLGAIYVVRTRHDVAKPIATVPPMPAEPMPTAVEPMPATTPAEPPPAAMPLPEPSEMSSAEAAPAKPAFAPRPSPRPAPAGSQKKVSTPGRGAEYM